MHTSLQSMAQLTMTTTADVTEIVLWREALAESSRPTYSDIMVKVVSIALRQHPNINATWQNEQVVLLPDIHIGIATAVDDGLVVPVIRNADRKSLFTIRDEAAALTQLARTGQIASEEVSGSTFTVTSLGGQGIDAFTPIINPPESAILGIGRITQVPAPGETSLIWRKIITLSLTIDHRSIDGLPGAAFLATCVNLLTEPQQLINDPHGATPV
jgi:pyruvate dehydrogenase E2 component (dihydrolipoamide acetyltransferase)